MLALPVAVSRVVTSISIVALLTLGACAQENGFAPSDEQADSSEVIELRLPAAPTEIEFSSSRSDASFGQSVAYGHCDPEIINDDGSTTINCPSKWSEVAWFHVSQSEVRDLMAQGHTAIDFELDVENSVVPNDDLRFSVHEVAEDGTKRKILSEPNFGHDQTVGVTLADVGYDIYFARGENFALIWGNGAIEFSIDAQAL